MEAQLRRFRDRDPAPDFPVAFCSCGDKLGFGEGPLATIRSNTQTGIRPEFTSQPDGGEVVDEVELLRAAVYSLLARLLVRAPDAALLREVAGIGGNDDDAAPLASARAALAEAAAKADPGEVEREYFTLFVGVGRGELLPYASYYRTGFLNERPLAELRRDLARIGIERAPGCHDPEDGIVTLCDVMGAFASGSLRDARMPEREFFHRHLAPWAGQFFADLATAPSARFYRAVGGLGASFIGIETMAFALDD